MGRFEKQADANVRDGMGPHQKDLSRRRLLEQMAGLSLGLPLSHTGLLPLQKSARQPKAAQHKLPAPPPNRVNEC